MVNRVSIARFGTRVGTKSDVYLNWSVYGKPDAQIGMDYFVWIVHTGESVIVVDTGFSTAGGEKRQRTFVFHPRDVFAALDVDPESAPEVLITHAHYDHIGNLDHFPRSRFTLSRAEYDFWASDMRRRAQFHHSVEDDDLAELFRAGEQGRVRCFDDELEIAEGVRMIRVGGHTPGQSIVLVDTAEGCVALASDAVHYYEEYEDDIPFAFVADLPAMYSGFDRLHEWERNGTVQHVVSGHDPATLERFGVIDEGPLAGHLSRIG